MPINDLLDTRIRQALTKSADFMAERARGRAPTKRIGASIEVGQVKRVADIYSVEISVSLKKAPEAGAYEYGSGVHATQGTPGTYPIVAKNAPNLVFWWEKRNKWFVGPSVNHPGVEASPYLKPSALEAKGMLKQALAAACGEALRISIRQSIKGQTVETW